MNATETLDVTDKAVAILEATHDGNNLYAPERGNGDGWQLALLQAAVNGHLKPSGVAIFDALYTQVLAGDFLYPYKEFVAKFCPNAEAAG